MGLTTLFLFGLVAVSAAHDNPFVELKSNIEFLSDNTNLDDPAYRLLDVVQPTDMFVDLDVFLTESRFNGMVRIHVNVNQDGLTQMVLHQNVISITAVTVVNSAGQTVPLRLDNNPPAFETDSYYEILKINLADPIQSGQYTITITYLGRINANPVDRGFYMGYYYLNNEKRYYATTQFQPYHARKAFPCFDEPQFKSRYVLSITRDSSLSPSYSNMAINETVTLDNNRIRETFLPTPIISAYLIAFHVSDFQATNATSTVEKPFQIISRQGGDVVVNQHDYAADMGLRITDELDDYLGIQYYDMGQGSPMKNDHIALPDFPSGAMENWGMVNYREAYLLYDPQNTNLVNRIFISTILAHELGHKWFGNLVTCAWWNNLWLNESFASFLEYFAVHWVDASYELDDQFVVDHVHSALNFDSFASANPMNWPAVIDNPSISAHFGVASYAKGASVLRMMEHFVGARTFRNSLRLYLSTNAYELGTPQKMYDAFRVTVANDRSFATTYPNIDVGAVFETWVENSGSPVLNVVVESDKFTITQRRFLISGAVPDTIWQVPVSWTYSGNLNFDTKPQFVLTGRSVEIAKPSGDHFVLLNNAQSGLYRVNYDEDNWKKIAAALLDNRESIHKLNRAQIVNDVLYFIRAEAISIDLAFEVLEFLKHETDYYVWAGALGQLDLMRRRLEHLPLAHEEFVNYLSELMDTVIDHLGYAQQTGDSTGTILNRMQIMNYACNTLGHEGCVEYALQRWRQYRQNDQNLVEPNERRYVYCVGIREGTTDDYNWLFAKYNASENTADMVVILRTLACTKDQDLIQHYLLQSLYNDRIRIHDKTNAFSFALQGNKESTPTVLNFVYNMYTDIRENYGGTARLNIAINALAAYLTDFQHITEFQRWLYAEQLNLVGTFNAGVNVINSAIANLEYGNKIAVAVFQTIRSRNSAAAITSPVVLLIVALTAQLFH